MLAREKEKIRDLKAELNEMKRENRVAAAAVLASNCTTEGEYQQ
jgi:hypothetical protein